MEKPHIFILLAIVILSFLCGHLLGPFNETSEQQTTTLKESLNQRLSGVEENSRTKARKTNSKSHRKNELDINSIYAKVETKNASEAEELRNLLIEWAKEDPLAALEFASSQIKPMSESDEAIRSILDQWMITDPDATWAWTVENAIHDSEYVINGIAKADPHLAWEMAVAFCKRYPERQFETMMSALRGATYLGDYASVLEMVTDTIVPVDIETPHRQFSFVAPIVEDWMTYSPEAVRDWVNTLPSGTEEDPRKYLAQKVLIDNWSSTDPLSTLDYADGLENKSFQNAARSMALTNLVEQDQELALEWIESRMDSGTYHQDFDWGLHDIATAPELITEDINMAISHATKISAPEVREGALTHIYKEWLLRDPNTANQFFENNPILTEHGVNEAKLAAEYKPADIDTEGPSPQD